MNNRPETLPNFESPPVVEVVLGVQFERISGFKAIHAGFLWEKFRDGFPLTQEQPPLSPVFETFGTNTGRNVPKFEFVSGPPPTPRLWFLDNEQTQLIQFQPDRFIHNWRKVQKDDVYPRYGKIKADYQGELSILREFFDDLLLGELRPNQCEVSYVNHIISLADEDLCSQPGKVFQFLGKSFAPEVFDKLEDTRFQMRFPLFSDDDTPVGRLHVNAQPGLSSDGTPMIELTLTARGVPLSPTVEAASQFLDFGRDKIVRAFAALTTEEMHNRWRRTQ